MQSLVGIPPNPDASKCATRRRQVSTGTQAAPVMAAHAVSTDAAALVHRGMSHTEGGWPREVDPTDAEAVARWRRRVERDEDYIRSVVALGGVVEGLVKQNNAIDIYEEYFAGKQGA
jgi:dynein intermediate chain 2